MSDREEHQQPAQDSRPKKAIKKKGAAAKKPTESSGPSSPTKQRRPAKLDFQQKQVVDYVREATRNNVWYYRDRVHGIIGEDTLVWGQGLHDFLPVRNIRTLVPQIRTLEVQAATWVKRTFALKPALNQIRKERAEHRQAQSDQVDTMY
ncbi:MAG: RNA binding [Trebouxia sp. A1-2]|nr:MAG: RNA binding [Trebouxia sp. A1-2]